MLAGFIRRFRPATSLRYKLLALVLIPLLLLTGTVILLAARWSTDYTYEQLFTKVYTDLQVAHDIFQRIQSDRQRELASLADSSAFLERLESDNTGALMALLETQRDLGGFDFLNLVSADGERRLQKDGWQPWSLRSSPLTDAVFSARVGDAQAASATGIEIYPSNAWQRESGVLASKVSLPLVETPRAAPTSSTFEDRAMVIRVLQRVVDRDGSTRALLEGGLLLNRNFAFVDEIRDLVYGPGSLAAGSRGTVTVFLDDVRITTNVPANDDTRALGTRVSAEVRQSVLERGDAWIARAFVVNDWYISAYEPIVDVHGDRVGMLYAGYLETPFRADLMRAIYALAAVVLAGTLLAVIGAILGAKSIFKPIEAMAAVARGTAAGERRRIGRIDSGDELGQLATQFDSMLDTQEEHRALIERDAQELERKVQRRTAELEQKNHSLQESIDLLRETRQQLAMAEKLAAIGEVTAGVAHEINNPTAVILGNMDILIDEIGSARESVQTEIDLIIEQVYRIRSITDRLLQYSRSSTDSLGADSPEAYRPSASASNASRSRPAVDQRQDRDAVIDAHFSADDTAYSTDELTADSTHSIPVEINEVVTDSLLLVRHELAQQCVQLRKTLGEPDQVAIDRQELQQVLVNLIMNAVQAVEKGGTIDVTTENAGSGQVCITVSDDGVGIEPSHMQRLFDPFFTSGKARGTGLGLSVSYGIVSRYGGQIDVQSTVGEGATFRVTLTAVTDLSIPPDRKDGSAAAAAAIEVGNVRVTV